MAKAELSPGVPSARWPLAPIVLSRRAGLWVSASVVAHTLWTSAAPAMAYRLYAQEWRLSHTVTTGIFAVYPIVVVAVLLGFGDLSDHIGRRATMLIGLGASLAGALLFAVAPNVLWLFAGRALMGVGVGLTAGPSTAAVVEFGTGGPLKRAALITTVAQAAGFAASLLLGGALIEYALGRRASPSGSSLRSSRSSLPRPGCCRAARGATAVAGVSVRRPSPGTHARPSQSRR